VFVGVEHRNPPPEQPPHTIISEPVQTAEWFALAAGAPAFAVADHVSVAGS
jgi:hypothetical protein